jgi:hypothetical protein
VIGEIDVRAVLSRSVCEFHSDLVTRSTGRAVRDGIEAHLQEHPDITIVVLDFSAVRVLDCSCADEIVAQLLLRSAPGPEAGDAGGGTYFLVRGLDEVHADQIDEVLRRHGLALAAEVRDGAQRLLGMATDAMRAAWERVASRGSAAPEELAEELSWPLDQARRALDALAGRRVVIRAAEHYLPLSAA